MSEFLKSCLGPIVDILKEYLLKHACYIIQVGDNVEALNREAEILEGLRQDVEEQIRRDEASLKKPTNAVDGWRERVKALQPKLVSINRDYNNRNCVCLGTCSFNCCSNHNIGMRAAEELVNVEREVKFIKDVKKDQDVTAEAPPPMVREVPTSTDAVSGGEIELKLRMALDFLKDGAQKMLGVYGMGGVGKTTLLKHINNAMVKDASFGFDRVVLVTASRDCTIGKIQMSIAKELGLSGATIYNYLRNKSFLILVDDLWECLDMTCEENGIPLPLGVVDGHKRKMILVSRSQQVLHGMGVRRSIRVECLSHEAAWFLFCENVGTEAITSHSRILELASQVADQCGGLPQALITIGRAMAENQNVQSWENAVEELKKSIANFPEIRETTGMIGDPLPLLKFSYDYLKDERKQQCLLHCALWPEDYPIRKDELIQCWMGHGLLGEINNLQDAYRKGHATIESLRKASLLEHVESEYSELKDDKVKLHDLIRDMALWIACNCGASENKWVVLAGQGLEEAPRDKKLWSEAHKISLMSNEIRSLPSEIQSSPNLTTLVLQGNKFTIDEGLRMSKYFNSLKYLDISRCFDLECFPTEICGLTKLEYLNISKTKIRSLPEELKALVNLKYLIARDNMIQSRVPPELLSNLVSLIELDLFESWSNIFVSSVIDDLDCLEGRLKGLGITVTTISNLQKLIQLSGIPISSLYLEGIEDLGSSLKLLSHDFLGSQHIRSNLKLLTLYSCYSVEEVVVEGKHQLNIERLVLLWAKGLKEIKWKEVEPRDVLHKLRELNVFGCHALKSIEWVMYLPCLEILELYQCEEMEQMFGEEAGASGTKQEEEDRPTFPSLRNLQIQTMPKLSSICHRPLTFPSLEVLYILNCKQLKRLPFNSTSSCTKLREIRCDEETWKGIDLEDNMRATLEPLKFLW